MSSMATYDDTRLHHRGASPVKGSVVIQRLESDGVGGEQGGADDGVAEPTVLELRVDNAVIRACLKVQWAGRTGCWNPNGAHPDNVRALKRNSQ